MKGCFKHAIANGVFLGGDWGVLQDKHGKDYSGLFKTFQRVYTEEGAASLMSGVAPRVRNRVTKNPWELDYFFTY